MHARCNHVHRKHAWQLHAWCMCAQLQAWCTRTPRILAPPVHVGSACPSMLQPPSIKSSDVHAPTPPRPQTLPVLTTSSSRQYSTHAYSLLGASGTHVRHASTLATG
eukprot:351856-Chlamydomonas_euryale.AAC.3